MANKAISAFVIAHKSGEPIGRQIYRALRQGIIEGRCSPGERLPASRTLAVELGVSRATVVGVYDQLVAEGFAQGRRGSGLFVSNIGQVEFAAAPPSAAIPTRRATAARNIPRRFSRDGPICGFFHITNGAAALHASPVGNRKC